MPVSQAVGHGDSHLWTAITTYAFCTSGPWSGIFPLISEFIEREFERWETRDIADHKRTVSSAKLDELFRESLAEVWRS